jgi:hypothetical protein
MENGADALHPSGSGGHPHQRRCAKPRRKDGAHGRPATPDDAELAPMLRPLRTLILAVSLRMSYDRAPFRALARSCSPAINLILMLYFEVCP